MRKTSGAPACIISGTGGNLSRNTNVSLMYFIYESFTSTSSATIFQGIRKHEVMTMDDYRDYLLGNLKKLYDDQILTDVTLQVGDVRIDCHRNVLAAASPYFR